MRVLSPGGAMTVTKRRSSESRRCIDFETRLHCYRAELYSRCWLDAETELKGETMTNIGRLFCFPLFFAVILVG